MEGHSKVSGSKALKHYLVFFFWQYTTRPPAIPLHPRMLNTHWRLALSARLPSRHHHHHKSRKLLDPTAHQELSWTLLSFPTATATLNWPRLRSMLSRYVVDLMCWIGLLLQGLAYWHFSNLVLSSTVSRLEALPWSTKTITKRSAYQETDNKKSIAYRSIINNRIWRILAKHTPNWLQTSQERSLKNWHRVPEKKNANACKVFSGQQKVKNTPVNVSVLVWKVVAKLQKWKKQ